MSVARAQGDAAALAARVGRRVREARLSAGMTQKALGENLSISGQQIQKYETGADTIPLHRLMAIARLFNLPVERFLGGGVPALPDPIPSVADDAAVMELIRAYRRIGNASARRQLLRLACALAGDTNVPQNAGDGGER
jgi:transcriptional regulator with XRE-family HTH domain